MPSLPIAVVPHPVAGQSPADVQDKARSVLPEIISILTEPPASLELRYRHKTIRPDAQLTHKYLFGAPGEGQRFIKAPESIEGILRLFHANKWTDGLPIIPPTEQRFNGMIEKSGWDPTTVIGFIAPLQGKATIEKIAVNALMAGCTASHLPVIIAAVRAMTQPQFNLYALQTTTHLCTVLALVNGPVVHDLLINCRYNAMGQGTLSNAVIGRAIRLILTNIGGAIPGVLDRATFGSPAKYTFCFGENEDESPWEPLHVERGFTKQESTVTIVGAEPPHNVNDHGSATADGVISTVAGTLATPGTNQLYMAGEPLVVLGPEHAAIIAREGLTKRDTKDRLHEKARVPLSEISAGNLKRFERINPKRFGQPSQNQTVPIAESSDDIMVVVSGGKGRHSVVIPTFGSTRSVTELITDADGNPL